MANRALLLCLLIVSSGALIECRGGRGFSSGRSSSSGRSWGSSSRGSSWSSSSRGSSRSSSSRTSSSSHSYPASSGLSGSSSHSYPFSSPGLSGSSSRGYLSSLSGVYGFGRLFRPGTLFHGYPSSNGDQSKSTYEYSSYTHKQTFVPTYYTSPQYIYYVNQYRHSDSRYGDILTGLALYNMGRSHSNYHEHYYNDDYYRTRYYSHGSSSTLHKKPDEEATCTLKIQENGQTTALKVPCEVVSTFTEGSRKSNIVNTTVCTTNTTVIKNIAPLANPVVNATTQPTTETTDIEPTTIVTKDENSTAVTEEPPLINMTSMVGNTTTISPTTSISIETTSSVPSTNALQTSSIITSTEQPNENSSITYTTNSKKNLALATKSNTNATINGTQIVPRNSSSTYNVTTVNVTVCSSTSKEIDPLEQKGSKLNSSKMRACIVEIRTKDHVLTNKVDCKVLMTYARMPEPRNDSNNRMLPPREMLKKLLSNPPWWMAILIAV